MSCMEEREKSGGRKEWEKDEWGDRQEVASMGTGG